MGAPVIVKMKLGYKELRIVKSTTVHQEFRVLRRMLNVAVRKKLPPVNPCSGVEFPVAVKGLFRPIPGWPSVVTNTPEGGDRATLVAVLVADDREFLRKAIRKVLDFDPEIRIVGEAENFPQTVALTRELHPRVVGMDLHMLAPEDFSHKDVKRALAETGSRLVTMSVWHDDASRALAASYGSFTFLDKSNLGQLLIPAADLDFDRAWKSSIWPKADRTPISPHRE
jgi:hypothetical protein